jgi:hypothetical protein
MKDRGFSAFSKRPLAAAVFSLFELASLEAAAAPAVTNCSDAGTGTLRAAVSGAAEGDFIDLTHLSCGVISLITGSIHILRNNLTIAGPGRDKLTINVANDGVNNVLSHYGTGTLEVDSVKVSGGHLYMTSSGKYFGGGCIGSFGSLRLNFVELTGCAVTAGDNAYGRGGAIFAAGDVHVVESVISFNDVKPGKTPIVCTYIPPPPPGGYVYCSGGDPRVTAGLMGGGVFAKGDVTLEETLVTGNAADAGGGVFARGGQVLFSTLSGNQAIAGSAMAVTGKSILTVSNSTVSENRFPRSNSDCYDDYYCRSRRSNVTIETDSVIEAMATTGGGQPTRISNSTFANNGYASSVIHSQNPLAIYNSTIALNRWRYYDTYTGAGGIAMDNAALTIASSIVSQNGSADVVLSGSATITGSHNLIGTSASTMPAGTLSGCPMLKSLDDNGGLTLTVSLRPHSPAIGTGSNPSGLPFDQRGSGFTRAMGSGPDIGAIEAVDDRIFNDEFQVGAPPVCT